MGEEYVKYTHLEHVLKRPDSYVGSTKISKDKFWVLADEGDHFVEKELRISPGLLKIFDEILVNAMDRAAMYPDGVTKINVIVDQSDGSISVENDGPPIPVEKNKKEGLWVPDMIFGHLLTGSNFNDEIERTTGGRNGYGAKLANIFSTKFEIDVNDGKKSYTQRWTNNMTKREEPKVKASKTKPRVKITFWPEWSKFGHTSLDNDVLQVFTRRAWDAAAYTDVAKVFLNGTHIKVKDILAYAKMHTEETLTVHSVPRWDVVACKSLTGARQLSWVNGICTTKGGSHVDHVTNVISKDVVAEMAKKKIPVRMIDVKNCMMLFVKSTIVNPSFSSQTKTELTSKLDDFGSRFSVDKTFTKRLLKSGIEEEVAALSRFKESRELKKSDGSKKSKIYGIPKLDDANWAGGPKSSLCTLIITEGDSAKTLAISGLSIVGRDKYGVFPLRGKPKNVRDASVKQLMSNQEFSDLKKILGLRQDKNYSSVSDLRYGRLMIMTDQDLDGSHIKGLVLNMFHVFWPSLIELGFVSSMVTPIIKVSHRSNTHSFYTDQAFRLWLDEREDHKRWSVKYYKGLGTSTSKEAKEYFREIEKLTVKFGCDDDTDNSLLLAFDKVRADDRKVWLKNAIAKPQGEVSYGDIADLSVSDFIHRDMVNFSIADVQRSIPHVIDGLKPCQRKVIYGCIKKNASGEMKVAQIAGYIAENTAYHHGEASLHGAIIGLAQDYTGSNNLNLLQPCGQFGTRLMGGKDAASPRYISTRLSSPSKHLFDTRDSAVLKYAIDDGKPIEPEFFVPTLPVVLINGAEGIGTGWSCFVPPHNPKDVAANIKRCLEGENPVPMRPWFKGFSGKTLQAFNGSWVFEGLYEQRGTTVIIKELPPCKWTQDYKEFLDTLVEKKKITGYENHSTEEKVHFRVRGYDGDSVVKDLGLRKTVRTSNMHLMTPSGIKKYETTTDILVDYLKVRIETYKKRKKHILMVLQKESRLANAKAEFVKRVIEGNIIVFRRKRKELEKEIADKGLGEFTDKLMRIETSHYTEEEYQKLTENGKAAKMAHDKLNTTNIVDMWSEDLLKIT